MNKRLFIHATNVHSGGGRALLNALLQSVPDGIDVIAVLDSRMQTQDPTLPRLSIRRVFPSIWQRLKAEWWLSKNTECDDLVLCFGNLPPLFKLKSKATIFLQNRYLVEKGELSVFPFKTRLRVTVERAWFSLKFSNASAFVVQTPSMKIALEEKALKSGKSVYLLPFVQSTAGYRRSLPQTSNKPGAKDFIYVASGEPHKNHRNLIQAWCILAGEGHYPTLSLTLNTKIHSELCGLIEFKKKAFGLRIENLGVLTHEQILLNYSNTRALIFPSTFESFGIPLVEARQAGLSVVASELDFVRDVLDPEQSFDPQSPASIARAVKRFIGIDDDALPLLNAAEFMTALWEQ